MSLSSSPQRCELIEVTPAAWHVLLDPVAAPRRFGAPRWSRETRAHGPFASRTAAESALQAQYPGVREWALVPYEVHGAERLDLTLRRLVGLERTIDRAARRRERPAPTLEQAVASATPAPATAIPSRQPVAPRERQDRRHATARPPRPTPTASTPTPVAETSPGDTRRRRRRGKRRAKGGATARATTPAPRLDAPRAIAS